MRGKWTQDSPSTGAGEYKSLRTYNNLVLNYGLKPCLKPKLQMFEPKLRDE